MEEKLAKITGTRLGYEDHGILTTWLFVDYDDGFSQGVGGHGLDDSRRDEDGEPLRGKNPFIPSRRGTAYGLEMITGVLEAVGVDNWEDLKGKMVWVIVDEGGLGQKTLGLRGFKGRKTFLFSDIRDRYFNNEEQ